MTEVSARTHEALAEISAGRLDALASTAAGQGEPLADGAGLDARSAALVQVATLIALDAPPASYASQVAGAIEAGADAEDLLGVLLTVGPLVGAPKTVAAAPEIMLALGLSLPESFG